MRRALLSLAVLATTTTTTRAARRRALASTPAAEGSPQDEYVRHWAHEGKSRCGAPNCRWMREFGPIDVGCRIEIDRVGLADGGAGPRFSLVFTDGRSTETIDARGASSVQNFVTRPALCEYLPAAARRNTTSEVALLMVANSPSYLFRLWGPFLNKLLFATDAGMRPMIWLGELPKALRKPTSEACLHSAEMKTRTITRRLAPTSYYDGKRTAGECSNHYIKMPATLATLAHPEIKGLYYVDLDSVARYPWTTSTRLREHENNFSDVSFHPLYGSKHMGSMRWQVSGNRYYARDSVQGRAFFASWFDNRCTFKDQYSLWHTILDFAASEGCVDYAGEIFSLTYSDARGMGPTHKNYIKLDCDAIDARCPGLRYSNRGGETCDADTPHLLDDLHHRSIGTDGKGILRLVLEGGFALSLENACFAGPVSKRCEVAPDLDAYRQLLGVAGRDRSAHLWNSTAASAPWEPVRADAWAAFAKGACMNYRATPKFSLAGNCGAPERLNATLTDKLYFFSWVSSHDGELLRHFLNFYTARGIRFKEPGRARLVVSPFRESRRALLDEFVHPNNIRFEPEYSSDRKMDAVNAYLTTLPAGYLMYPDLDEFFDIPSATLDEAIVHGGGFVLGTMVDRVAYDWTLPSVAAGPLWSQFPRRCFATNKLFNGNSRKWLLVPTYIPGLNRTLQYAGSHKLQGEDLENRLKGAKLRCYGFSHYRFGAKSVKLLRDKLGVYHRGPPGPDQTRHEVYERISSFLVDATPEQFSDKFQHTVECLESCPTSPPRRALASAPVESQDEYVQNWAHEGKSRCGAPNCRWIREFGPIDVGCRIEIDRVGLADGGAGPRFSLVFSDGRRKTRDASSVHQLVTRPALCEYAPRNTTSSDVALLMVANEPSYLFRMWGPFLNKLLWAIDAGLRPMLWLGDLPERLQTHSSEQCRRSSEMRHLEYNGEAQRYSPRYIKIPATLAALAAPDIKGVYYVDMDAVVRFPWNANVRLSEHTRGQSDVSFLAHDGGLRWQVKSSRFYARNSAKGRAFFANWFENRCTSDDKYALWHTMLESAASEGCVPYDDEILRMRYSEAKHLKADDAPAALLLDCRTIDAKCPSFSYSNTGGHAACNNTPPDLLDDLRLQGSGRDGLLRLWLDDYALTVENACFATDGRCEYASDVSEFAALLGVADRDRKLHPWNSTAASAPWEPAPADSWAAYTKGACRDFHAPPKFSLAGNCGAPERLNATLTNKLYFYSWVSSHDGELLRHFLLFYTARGIRFKEPGRARLVVSPFRESRRELLDEFVHPNNIRFEPEYTSGKKRDAVNAYLKTLPAGHFLMYPDLDEFFDIPSATLDEAIVHGDGFVLGTMVDRVAYDWTLPSVAEGPLWSQFPRRCFATNKLFNGYTKKWILVPTSHNNRTIQYASSHNLHGMDLLKGAKLKCYGFSHYRFGAKSVKLLRDKLNTYRSTDHRHTMYETISGYLVDATPEEFSKTFQHSVECLESCPAPPLHAPEPAEGSPQDEYARSRALATVGEIDRWFKFGNERYAPKAWTVTKPDDVPLPWQQLKGGQAKSVYRATVKGKSVIVKEAKHASDTKKNVGGGSLYLEMVYLEALRGRPGIPELLGAWWDAARDGPHITYVVGDGGEPLGKGPSGVGTQPNVMTAAFDARARDQPLALAKSILECFGSWASDFFQDDFKAQQFTMDAHGTVFMVDGPVVEPDRPLGRAIWRAWGPPDVRESKYPFVAHSCTRDADCPFTKESHSCRGAGTCEPGARGAPEARGECREDVCVRLSEKTHVYDVANRPWLLPYIAAKAADPAAGEFLRSLIRLAGRGRPEDRPSFRELVDRIDEFVKAPVPFEPGPKARLYESAVIQSNDRRRKAFWDYASVSFTDLGHAGGVLVDELIRALCDDRGLACWESGVDGHGKDVPVPAHLGGKLVDRTKSRYGKLSEEDKEDSGHLDILDGEFPFNVTRVRRALPPKVFAFTVVEDAWRVVESLYVDGGRADDPDAFVDASFPHGVQRHALRLAGVQPSDHMKITRSQCDRALRNLDAFDLIVDAASLATGGLRDLATVLYGLYDVEAPQVATVKPVGGLAASPSIRARVLEDSWCHAEVYAAARSKPAFLLV